jgi:hypothetical protein
MKLANKYNTHINKSEGSEFDTPWSECLNLPNPSGPQVYSASNRNEYQNIKVKLFLGSKVRRVRKADNLTAIYEPTV